MARGGKRKGAGAPMGNLNGFKNGSRSRRWRKLMEILEHSPTALRLVAEALNQRERRPGGGRQRTLRQLLEFVERYEQAERNLEVAAYLRGQQVPRGPGSVRR